MAGTSPGAGAARHGQARRRASRRREADPTAEDWDDARLIDAAVDADYRALEYRFHTDKFFDVGISAFENWVWRLWSAQWILTCHQRRRGRKPGPPVRHDLLAVSTSTARRSPLYGIQRVLLGGAERYTLKSYIRLLAWIATRELRHIHGAGDLMQARDRLLTFYIVCVDAGVPELHRPARTIIAWHNHRTTRIGGRSPGLAS